jgi:Secretion system C-terminal sorting domain
MKKTHLLPLVFLFFVFSLSAQSIERQVIGIGGNNNTDEQILLDWTLGETFTAFDNAPFGHYKEGFLQPLFLNEKLDNPDNQSEQNLSDYFDAEVFPNPFNGIFTFQINNVLKSDAQLIILDYSGRVLMKKILPVGSLKMEWAINDYPSGLYFLQFVDDFGVLKQSFKLMKL